MRYIKITLLLLLVLERASFSFLKHPNIFIIKKVRAFLLTYISNDHNFLKNSDILIFQKSKWSWQRYHYVPAICCMVPVRYLLVTLYLSDLQYTQYALLTEQL
jgi:hypothetical protein